MMTNKLKHKNIVETLTDRFDMVGIKDDEIIPFVICSSKFKPNNKKTTLQLKLDRKHNKIKVIKNDNPTQKR